MKKLIFIFSILIFLFINFSYSDFLISKDNLQNYGIKDVKRFYVAKISEHGKYLVAYELEKDIHKIAEGKKVIIWIFYLNKAKTKITNVKNIYVPLIQIEQIYPSTDEKKIILMGNNGTKILIMDAYTGKYYTLYKFERNKPGFRGDKLAFSYKNNFYVYGYFYDKNHYVTQDRVLVRVDLSKKGLKAFKPVYDYEKVHEIFTNPPISGFKFISENQSIVVTVNRKKKLTNLYFLYNKFNYKKIDTSFYMSTAAVCDNIVGYTVGYKKNKKILYWVKIYDFKNNKYYNIIKNSIDMYSYPFISTDGKIFLFAQLTGKGRMYLYYAKSNEGYKIAHKLPTDKGNSYLGACKLSGDGKIYTHQTRKGIYVGLIK